MAFMAPSSGWARPQSKPEGQSFCAAHGRVHTLSAPHSILPQSALVVQASPIFLSVMGSAAQPASTTRLTRRAMDHRSEDRRIPASSPALCRLSNAFGSFGVLSGGAFGEGGAFGDVF